METTNDLIKQLNVKFDDLISAIKPVDTTENSDTKLILEAINNIKLCVPNIETQDIISETEPVENKKFIRRMWISNSLALIVSALLSVFTFKTLVPAFPFMLGLFVVFMGTSVWLYLDEILFEGYSIGKVAKNAVSVSVSFIAISILYFTGIFIGNTYVSNQYGNDNEKPQSNIEAVSKPNDNGQYNSNTEQQQPATSRSQGSVLSVPASQGNAQSEQ